jgi:hypothetical protein
VIEETIQALVFGMLGYDFYYALSNDNGQTFSVNQAMSNQFIPFDSLIAGDGNDFLSAVYSGDTLYTVWGDTRNGKLNIWFAKTIASTNTTVDVNILNESNDLFEVFPNPAAQELKIIFNQLNIATAIDIYNLQGQKVISLASSNLPVTLDISDLSPGLYFVKSGNCIKRFNKNK